MRMPSEGLQRLIGFSGIPKFGFEVIPTGNEQIIFLRVEIDVTHERVCVRDGIGLSVGEEEGRYL
jgi:hypothetical protein